MSKILEGIKSVIKNSIQVEVKSPIVRNNQTKYPVLVTDTSKSFTSGWYIAYQPVLMDNGTRLYDGSGTFTELNIANFSQLQNMVLTANYYFVNNIDIQVSPNGFKSFQYELNQQIRLVAIQAKNSVRVDVTIIDENSPFYMMSIEFYVMNTNPQQPYIVGTNDRWDRNTDVFRTSHAKFAPRKKRFYRVHQELNQAPRIDNVIAVKNNQFQIYENYIEVDTEKVKPEYIQIITNEYKALAFIYEKAIMEIAFERALQQGLSTPSANQNLEHSSASNAFPFTPAFTIENTGQPNPMPANPANDNQPMMPNAPYHYNEAEFQQNQKQPLVATEPIQTTNGINVNPNDLPFSIPTN